MYRNNDPFQPWNDPCYSNDPLAAHNDPIYRDDPTKPWNNPAGSRSDLNDHDASTYGIRRSRYSEEDYFDGR